MRNKWHIPKRSNVQCEPSSALSAVASCIQVLSLLFMFSLSCIASSETAEPPERVVFGGDLAYPPFEWLESGSPRGFNIDYAQALGKLSGTKVEHRLARWPDTIKALEAGHVDVVPMFVSSERQQKFLFTRPFHYIDHGIYARENADPIYAVSKLANKRVAVEERSFAERRLETEAIGAVLVLTGSTIDAIAAVVAGDADYAVLAAPIADRLIQKNRLPVKRTGPPFWPRAYAFAVRKDRAALSQWLHEVLEQSVANGTYQDVYESWEHQLQDVTPDKSRIIRIGVLSLLGLAGCVAIVLVWSWGLRRKVRTRTYDLRKALERAKTAESDARHLAEYDASTGLAKSHQFSALVDSALTKRSSVDAKMELLIVQLKKLDDVVGTLGQEYSEELIKQFANKLKSLCQGPCGYFGRAVFAVFADQTRVREIFAHLSAQQTDSYFYLAGGSALYPEHGNTSTELIRRAETALVHSTSDDGKPTLYDPSMEPDRLDLEIVSAFREKRIEGLSSVFQPQIDLKTGNVVAAESLVRWDHPDFGPISPVRFIPLLEKAGLIAQVTFMMINEAVLMSAKMRQLHYPIVISVNVAVYDLLATDIKAIVSEALQRHDGHAEDLKLELTETSFASDTGQTKRVLESLSEIGVSISIDDFGTGYSSLSYLSAFPVEEIKIDRTFVRDMVTNVKHRSIVQSTISLADHLGLESVAEGAEDLATVQLLKDCGCKRVQGYVFSKPLPERDFVDFVTVAARVNLESRQDLHEEP